MKNKQIEIRDEFAVLDSSKDGLFALIAIRRVEITIYHIEESVECRVIATHLAVVETIHILHLIK